MLFMAFPSPFQARKPEDRHGQATAPGLRRAGTTQIRGQACGVVRCLAGAPGELGLEPNGQMQMQALRRE